MIQRFNLLVSHVIPKVSEPGGGVHSIPGPDLLRHGQETHDMPAHVYYKRMTL